MLKINENKVVDQDGQDVSDKLIHFLFQDAQIDGSFTLQNLFQLMELNPILKDVYRQNFAHELCKEALKGPSENAIQNHWRKRNPESEDLDYIELYEHIQFNSREKETYDGNGFLQMHAVSYPLAQDDENYGKKGDTIPFSVSLTPIRDLLLLPIKINTQVQVFEDDTASKKFGTNVISFNKKAYSLGRIFEGILWEMSFHGDTSTQQEFANELKQTVNELKEGAVDAKSFTSIDDIDLFYELYAEKFDKIFECSPQVSQWVKNKVFEEIKDLEDDCIVDKSQVLKCIQDAKENCNADDEKMAKFEIPQSFENMLNSISFKEDFIKTNGENPKAITLRAYKD